MLSSAPPDGFQATGAAASLDDDALFEQRIMRRPLANFGDASAAMGATADATATSANSSSSSSSSSAGGTGTGRPRGSLVHLRWRLWAHGEAIEPERGAAAAVPAGEATKAIRALKQRAQPLQLVEHIFIERFAKEYSL